MTRLLKGRGIRILGPLMVVWLSACAGITGGSSTAFDRRQDAAPRHDEDWISHLQQLPDPEVKAEPRSASGNGPIYTVWGTSYRVMETAEGFRDEGLASWYGSKFHGRKTSSGEPFDVYQLTAAHRHLPLPTYVRVTNLANNRQTIVKVNDRGAFKSDRIIDLSYAAAVKLGFHRQGTSRVRIEAVFPQPVEAPVAPEEPATFLLQAGAFSTFDVAEKSHLELSSLTGVAAMVVKTPADGLFRVRLGPITQAQLPRLQALLQAADYGVPQLIPLP